jgi:hypothetical protein
LAALLLACPALAQDAGPASGSVSDYRLPPGPSASPSKPAVQGPTDPEHPVAAPHRPARETETAAPPPSSATTAPRITLPPATGEANERRGTERREHAPSSRPTPSPEPTITPTATPDASPAPVASEPAPPAVQPSAALPPVPAASAQPAPAGLPWPLLLAGLAGLLAIAAGLWLWLRSRRNPLEQDEAAEGEAMDALPVSAPATLAPVGASPPGPPPTAAPPPRPSVSGPIEFSFEPQSLRLSFVYATLAYRLTLANRGDMPFTELRIAADMTSGHASQPIWQLLAPDSGQLPEQHRVAVLAVGETLALEGSIQLPLADVLPLRAGEAMLLAPLARFRVEGQNEDGGSHASAHVFSIGLPSASRADTMQPFRLDHGPQLFRPIEQREVEVERWLQLDEARQAG